MQKPYLSLPKFNMSILNLNTVIITLNHHCKFLDAGNTIPLHSTYHQRIESSAMHAYLENKQLLRYRASKILKIRG